MIKMSKWASAGLLHPPRRIRFSVALACTCIPPLHSAAAAAQQKAVWKPYSVNYGSHIFRLHVKMKLNKWHRQRQYGIIKAHVFAAIIGIIRSLITQCVVRAAVDS